MVDETFSAPIFGAQCPIPIEEYPTVVMAHGGGGRLTQMLIDKMFVPTFSNPVLTALGDGAVLDAGGARLAFSTDSYVISPYFFPGGDIGSLAVHGTVNDLAMCGARPVALSAGLILEEGLPMQDLWRVIQSIQTAATTVGVPVVTGDTKVVDHGKGDGIYINTTGIGLIPAGVEVAPTRARPGDIILINGAIAVHGIAIMSVREGLEFETSLESDSAPLADLAARLFENGGENIHVLRDPTRGGVGTTLNELAAASGVGVRIRETDLPLRRDVQGACELLGLDPLYLANEGKLLAFVAPDAAERLLARMRQMKYGENAAAIGELVADHPGEVVLETVIGSSRIVSMLHGEPLPRIC